MSSKIRFTLLLIFIATFPLVAINLTHLYYTEQKAEERAKTLEEHSYWISQSLLPLARDALIYSNRMALEESVNQLIASDIIIGVQVLSKEEQLLYQQGELNGLDIYNNPVSHPILDQPELTFVESDTPEWHYLGTLNVYFNKSTTDTLPWTLQLAILAAFLICTILVLIGYIRKQLFTPLEKFTDHLSQLNNHQEKSFKSDPNRVKRKELTLFEKAYEHISTLLTANRLKFTPSVNHIHQLLEQVIDVQRSMNDNVANSLQGQPIRLLYRNLIDLEYQLALSKTFGYRAISSINNGHANHEGFILINPIYFNKLFESTTDVVTSLTIIEYQTTPQLQWTFQVSHQNRSQLNNLMAYANLSGLNVEQQHESDYLLLKVSAPILYPQDNPHLKSPHLNSTTLENPFQLVTDFIEDDVIENLSQKLNILSMIPSMRVEQSDNGSKEFAATLFYCHEPKGVQEWIHQSKKIRANRIPSIAILKGFFTDRNELFELLLSIGFSYAIIEENLTTLIDQLDKLKHINFSARGESLNLQTLC